VSSSANRVSCSKWCGTRYVLLTRISNPKGIVSSSPGLPALRSASDEGGLATLGPHPLKLNNPNGVAPLFAAPLSRTAGSSRKKHLHFPEPG
jgi:hypothetical protein